MDRIIQDYNVKVLGVDKLQITIEIGGFIFGLFRFL